MLKTTKIVGLNSDTFASLALVSERQIQGSLSNQLFAVVFCRVDDAFSRVRQSLVEVEDSFTSSESSIGERLSECLAISEKSLSDAQEKDILLAVVQEDEEKQILYLLGKKGRLQSLLLRDGKRTVLSSGAEEYQLVSGVLKGGDMVILTTANLLSFYSEIEKLSSLSIEDVQEELSAQLPHGGEDPVAAIVLKSETEKLVEENHSESIQEVVINNQHTPEFSLNLQRPLMLAKRAFRRTFPRSARGNALLGMFLLVIVIVSVAFVFKQKKDAEVTANFNTHFQAASTSYTQALAIKDVDQPAAISQINKAKEEIKLALKIKPKDGQAQNLQKQIDAGTGDVLKMYQVADIPLWLDLDLIKKGFVPKDLSLSHGNLLLLDPTQQTLVEVNLASKSPTTLAGGDKLGQGKLDSLNGDLGWVFSSDKGVIKVDTRAKSSQVAIKPDSDWGSISQIYGFANNLYMVDEVKNQIWKYVPIESGYSDKAAYFKDGVSVALIGTKKIQIDSSVWILRTGGELNKYTQGASDFFSFSGLDKPVNNPKSFFVSDQTENLYLLDNGNDRLVVLDKKGVYKAQYKADSLVNFTDLVVDEEGKKAYLLSGSKIYQLDLR